MRGKACIPKSFNCLQIPRAALLTGKYPEATGVYPGVFWADSVGGLPKHHKTLAERLSKVGYATSILGKWHLGVGANGEHLPTRRGFDRDVDTVDFCA